MKTKWNLALLYSSIDDPKIESDMRKMESAYEAFAKKYKGKEYLKDKNSLLLSLNDYEKLALLRSPLYYFYFLLDLDTANKKANALKNNYFQRFVKTSNKLIFYTLSLADFDEKKQREILADPKFSKYKYFFERIFISKKHKLSEPEEKIMNLKSQTSRNLWVDGGEKLLNGKEIHYKKNTYSVGEAVNRIRELPQKDRYALDDKILETLKDCSYFSEQELNAIVIDKKINDELRGFKEPYSSTVLNYENEEESVVNLVSQVTKAFPISHRFYALKRKVMKLPKLRYCDKGVAVGNITKKIPFEEAVSIITKSFASVDSDFADIFQNYLKNGQIDVYPKKGKTGGAYCSSDVSRPTFVLSNYTEGFDSVMTLAHEMGHSIHAEYSQRHQPPMYADHTISVAEVASTLFENFAFEEMLGRLNNKEKALALFNRVYDDIGTIFRQIACFNFELEMHKTIREKGNLSKEELAKMMNKHMLAYLGPNFKLREEDGYFFVYWSHIRNFFYVYSYAYGQLISKVLYKKYKEDPSFIKNIKAFLSSGESMSPEDIFKKCGLDTRDPKFFEEGLKSIEEDIKNLEKLLKKEKMI